VRIPGVIKLKDGEYTSLALHIDLEQTLLMRESIIYHTAKTFNPDIFLVDKEPTGLQGEVRSTLEMLQHKGCINVLGLRDVMDEIGQLKIEWTRKKVPPVLDKFYHDIWVYGLNEMGNPVDGLDLPVTTTSKIAYTGYLGREIPSDRNWVPPIEMDEPFTLITAGGGGDGAQLVDWVLRAYEADAELPRRAVIVTGPFMSPAEQQDFHERCDLLGNVDIIAFDSHIELLMEKATAIVAMGGYNTFCEILTLDKPALIVPRSVPRQEQLIRAERAVKLGLVSMLDPAVDTDVERMIKALQSLPEQPRPSLAKVPGLLAGHRNIADMVRDYLEPSEQASNTA
jgi:predicted glycosyltransferase